ncbi:MAG: hypothetical protein IJX00_03060 [Clostridia bacterium]|nr:hypothetical protein [Clostridia bacterium]
MSLIVTSFVNEGIVMAADSRITLKKIKPNGPLIETSMLPFSDSANKIFVCPNGCGISACGDAGYRNKPIAGFIEQFIENHIDKNTKVSDIPKKIIEYFNNLDITKTSTFHVAGYEEDNGEFKQQIFKVITGRNNSILKQQTDNMQGALWDGESLILTKLMKCQILIPPCINVKNLEFNVDGETKCIENAIVINRESNIVLPEAQISWENMSLQDAVDFVVFAIETTIKSMRFLSVYKTVGGPIDILIIKPKDAKWLQRKKLKAK